MGWFNRKKDIDPDNEHRDWLLISELAKESLKEQKRARRWGIFFKSLIFIYVLVLLVGLSQQGGLDVGSITEKHTAIIYLEGTIAANETANAGSVSKSLRRAFQNESSQGVVLVINSPGGSPVQAGYIYDEILRLQEQYPDKKLYAVIEDIGASGGYYVAAAANEIYANESSLVGSIGVTASSFGFVGLMEKLGIERRNYTAGDHKSFLDPFSPQREDEAAFWEDVLLSTHEQFISVVKRGRGDRLVENEEVFSGLIWNGKQALDLGLIDGLGSPGYVARELIGTQKTYDYTVRPTPFETFTEQFAVALGKGIGYSLETFFNSPANIQ